MPRPQTCLCRLFEKSRFEFLRRLFEKRKFDYQAAGRSRQRLVYYVKILLSNLSLSQTRRRRQRLGANPARTHRGGSRLSSSAPAHALSQGRRRRRRVTN